jgi:hypothetical protein
MFIRDAQDTRPNNPDFHDIRYQAENGWISGQIEEIAT